MLVYLFRTLLIVLLLSSALPLFPVTFSRIIDELYRDESIEADSLYSIYKNWDDYETVEEPGRVVRDYNVINDSLTAPFYYYIPENYDAEQKAPLLIYLHGGVTREEFLLELGSNIAVSPFRQFADENGWLLLYPLGNIDTTWWSETGIANISYQIRFLKAQYNIDDDRVIITGFSDGGSGSYHLSMVQPDDFAAFYPLSSNLIVGSVVTGLPVYTSNMRNRFLRAVNTDKDTLYPAERMRLIIEVAQKMGANIFFREYWGYGHDYGYAEQDFPLMVEDMKKRVREFTRTAIYWETTDLTWGRCDWIEITEIDTLRTPLDWHNHEVLILPDETLSFGFYDDREYEDSGVRVTGIVEQSAAEEIGLQEDDIIIAMDRKPVKDIAELLSLRNAKNRGDSFSLTVLRDEDELLLQGAFPPVTYHGYFDYKRKSGAVKGTFRGNVFDIETSRVSELSLYIHPGMVNLDIPVRVYVNGEELFNDYVQIDRQFMTANFIKNRDRSALWVNRITLRID
jgi:predicted esterase